MPAAAEPQVNEVELLRTANAELSVKAKDRKAKIAELESKLATAETALHEATVGAPLRQLAHTVSPVPELWLAQFAKKYKVELRDGKLTVLDAAKGEPVTADGKPVEFTAAAIAKLVTTGDSDSAKTFQHITVGSLARGGGAAQPSSTSPISAHNRGRGKDEPRPNLQQFGLR